MFAGLAAKLLAVLVAAALCFACGFGLEWHLRNGDAALAALKQQQAYNAELKHQTALAQASGAAGQAMADQAADAFAGAQAKIQTVTRTIIRTVPTFIMPSPTEPKDAPPADHQPVIIYGVPCGLVRLHDAAVTANASLAAVPGCTGESDDAPAPVDLSRLAAVLIDNYGACQSNASQLVALQKWALDVQLWYADVVRGLTNGER